MCAVVPWLQAHGLGVPQQLSHYISHVSGCATAAISTAVAAADCCSCSRSAVTTNVHTATYKRVRFFVRWAVAERAFNGGSQTATVLQQKMQNNRDPPQGHEDGRLLEGAARIPQQEFTEMAPSLRRAIRFPPGTHSAGTSPEMGQAKTEFCLAIAPQSSEQTKKP